MSEIKLITWNVLSSVLTSKYGLTNDDCITRLDKLLIILTQLIKEHPNSIINLQEFGNIEREKCKELLTKHKYKQIYCLPTNMTNNNSYKYWLKNDDICPVIFVPKKINVLASGAFNLTKFIPTQNDNVIFPNFIKKNDVDTNISLIKEIQCRTSSTPWVLISHNNLTYILICVHLPSIYNMSSFQAIILEALKNIVSILLKSFVFAKFAIVIGDWNISTYEIVNSDIKQLWFDFIMNNNLKLLPENFIGVNDIKIVGYNDYNVNFISNYGKYKSMLEQCVIFTRKTEEENKKYNVKFSSIDGSEQGMTERGPSEKYISDHIPLLYEINMK